MLYDSNHATLWERQDCGDGRKRNLSLAEVREREGMAGLNTEESYGSETTLCDTVTVDIGHYASVTIHRRYDTKSEF